MKWNCKYGSVPTITNAIKVNVTRSLISLSSESFSITFDGFFKCHPSCLQQAKPRQQLLPTSKQELQLLRCIMNLLTVVVQVERLAVPNRNFDMPSQRVL